MWIADHLPAVVSDFHVFHRIEDPFRLPSSQFFGLAEWMPAYAGATLASLRLAEQKKHPAPVHQQPVTQTPPSPTQEGVVQIDDVNVLASYVPDLIDYGG